MGDSRRLPLLAVLALVLASPRAPAQPHPQNPDATLVDAQELTRRGLLRQAEQRLTALAQRELGGRQGARTAAQLADVYYRSGRVDPALQWARGAIARIDGHRPSDPSWLAEDRVLAGTIAVRALTDRGRLAEAAAELEALAALDAKLEPDPLRTLQRQALAAEVAPPTLAAPYDAAWRSLREQMDSLRSTLGDTSAPHDLAWRKRANWAVAEVLARFNRYSEAAQRLETLLPEYSGKDELKTRVAVLSRLARRRAQAGDPEGQRAALRDAILLIDRDAPADELESIEKVDLALAAADLRRRLAAATPDDEALAITELLTDARAGVDRAQRALDASGAIDEEDRLSRQVLASKRLVEVAQAGRRAGLTVAPTMMARLLADLHERLHATVLPEDPRLAYVRAALGAEHVSAAEYAAAEAALAPAAETWRGDPAWRLELARTLTLLSEVRQAQGRLADARALLVEADGALSEHASHSGGRAGSLRAGPGYFEALPEGGIDVVGDRDASFARAAEATLAPWVQVNLGRIAAAEGRYASALARFDAAERLSRKAVGDADAALAGALVHRGATLRTLGRLDAAEENCRGALEVQSKRLPPVDAQLLPYHLALGGIAIARRDPDALGESVRAAKAIVDHDPNVPAPPALWHQNAMVHFLQDGRAPSAAARREAERIWRQALEVQEEKGLLVDQARSLHYLSRVRFRDAVDALEQARSAERAADSEYARALRELRRETHQHTSKCGQLTADRRDYLDRLSAYRGNAVSDREAAYQELVKQRGALARRADELADSGAAIQRRIDALESKYVRGEADAAGAAEAGRAVDEADRLAARACSLLADLETYPRLHYAALCNHAEVLRARAGDDPDGRAAAVGKLSEALALVEAPRLGVGDEAAQREFFARHATAFDLLVDWSVEDGRVRDALVHADTSRNRTFLDQLRASGREAVETRESPSGERSHTTNATAEYRTLYAQFQGMTERDPRTLTAAEQDDLRNARARLRTLRAALVVQGTRQEEQSRARRNLLASALTPEEVGEVVDRATSAAAPTLYYYVGHRRSYLFLFGFVPGETDVVPLVSQGTGPDGLEMTPAGAETIDRIVDDYVSQCSSPGRAAAIMSGGPLTRRLARGAGVILPPVARDRVNALSLDDRARLTIVPDGPLFRLPFVALVTSGDAAPRFLLDEAPPIVVAPSLMVRESLARPLPTRAPSDGPTLLSLARPRYVNAESLASAGPETAAFRYAQLGGPLGDLPSTEVESNGVCEALGTEHVAQIMGADATEKALRAAVAADRPRIVHLATHGVASDEAGAVQGALALAAPVEDPPSTENDAFLELHEIAELPLEDCDLAVLSACRTYTGPDRPMEMGSSFARAFLAAGARRVAATGWEVSDESGAHLVVAFFESLAEPPDDPDYARAMHEARLAVRRQNPDWDTPYHWAVFTLIGPAE